MDYSEYQDSLRSDVEAQISKLRCQPVLFFGSGISRRYFNAPNWAELLKELAERCPLIDKDYAYYAQSCTSEPQIGSTFADLYREWAWSTGKNQFPPELFEADVPPDAFFKSAVATIIKSHTPENTDAIDNSYKKEIEALQKIRPHAVITTNYDDFLEKIFPDHTAIVGQSALKGMPFSVGEIFKFHGCVDDVNEIVITNEDYEHFHKKKKFVAARLLSLFNEHPMLIAGYGANDPNIKAILSDIDEALTLPGSLVENIYFVEYDPDAESKASLPTEKLIQIEENRSVRVKLIVTSDFEWVFDAFKSLDSVDAIPPNIMRALLARSYELVRSDIPRTSLKVDFDFLERKLESQDEFAKLFGITTVNDASFASALFPYSLTEMGQKLGGNGWHHAHKITEIIKRETGIDIKSTDNKFHHLTRVNKSNFHKYSDAAFELFLKVQTEGHCDISWLNIDDSE